MSLRIESKIRRGTCFLDIRLSPIISSRKRPRVSGAVCILRAGQSDSKHTLRIGKLPLIIKFALKSLQRRDVYVFQDEHIP